MVVGQLMVQTRPTWRSKPTIPSNARPVLESSKVPASAVKLQKCLADFFAGFTKLQWIDGSVKSLDTDCMVERTYHLAPYFDQFYSLFNASVIHNGFKRCFNLTIRASLAVRGAVFRVKTQLSTGARENRLIGR